MKIITIFIILFSLICLLMYLNKKLDFKPLRDNEKNFIHLESFYTEDDPCKKSDNVIGCGSCYRDFIKGKQLIIDNLNTNLKKTSDKNVSDINQINSTVSKIQLNIKKINENLYNAIKKITITQNDLLTKMNEAAESIKKAQSAADVVDMD